MEGVELSTLTHLERAVRLANDKVVAVRAARVRHDGDVIRRGLGGDLQELGEA